jgi:hypothetical protein
MILAYKIEYLLYLLDGKKIVRRHLRAKPLVGPKKTREQEWKESFALYNQLLNTLKR